MSEHPRGDVKVAIDGKDYILVPNFKAIAAIQRATGLGLGELITALGIASGKQVRVDIVAEVLQQAIIANGQAAPELDAIGEAVIDSISEEDQPLISAAVKFLTPYFGKRKQVEEKKPAKAKAPTAG